MAIDISLLGGFAVRCDGRPVPSAAWGRRQAAALVKLLALSPGHRLHREQVIDALWPDDSLAEAGPKLHKAAHYARRATGEPSAVVLGGETVALFPDHEVVVDAIRFAALAEAALRGDDPAAIDAALALDGGDLLPADPYEDWVEPHRQHLRQLRADVLRRGGRWEELVALDPTDEQAHLAIMRGLAEQGDRHGALRQFERLDRALARELGVGPDRAAGALRDQLLAAVVPEGADPPVAAATRAGPAADDGLLVGRAPERAAVDALLRDVEGASGRTLVVTGPPGVGKTALLAWIRARAEAMGWRTGLGVAAAVEGAWAYAPVLEAVADLCRRHPTLLDGLDDNYRTEIDRALAGTDLSWTGEGGHQRLFVAVAELLRLAAVDRGAVLLFDDFQEADDASTRLVHYLARSAGGERIAVVVAHRPGARGSAFAQVCGSLVARGAATVHELEVLEADDAASLVQRVRPDLDDALASRVVELAEGLPFALVELARQAGRPAWERSAEAVALARVSAATREILQRVAVLGATFATDEFVAVGQAAGGAGGPDDAILDHLDAAIAAGIVEHTGLHYQFRHGLVREALTRDVAPHRRARIHREAATGLEALGASPARIGHHLVEAGDPAAAGPHLIRAAEREAAIGAYRDALELVDRVQAHVDGALRARGAALRADLLFALGDPSAPAAYRHALQLAEGGDAERLLRARLSRAAVIGGDLDTAVAAVEGVELDGGAADGDLLLARGQIAYATGDLDGAWQITEDARRRVLGGDQSWQVLDVIALQGLLAHHRGEWFDRMRLELQRTRQSPEMALAIFDGYLCAAEYLLYGPTPYADVIELARELRETAERAGALRAVAFASALLGEAALLAGDLDLAARELRESVDLHRDIAASSGEAHSLQRLAEVHLARGEREAARPLLHRALLLARWSPIALHLLQRIFGSMIQAAPDPGAARAVVDQAESALGTDDYCYVCSIMLAVPAAIACAQVGDVEHARHHLEVARRSAGLWDGTSWQGALLEAQAHLATAEGAPDEAARLRTRAADLFERAGQPLDVARCRAG